MMTPKNSGDKANCGQNSTIQGKWVQNALHSGEDAHGMCLSARRSMVGRISRPNARCAAISARSPAARTRMVGGGVHKLADVPPRFETYRTGPVQHRVDQGSSQVESPVCRGLPD